MNNRKFYIEAQIGIEIAIHIYRLDMQKRSGLNRFCEQGHLIKAEAYNNILEEKST